MRKRTYLLAALLCFVLSLALGAPAALLYAGLRTRLPELQLLGVDGSIYEGQAAALRLNDTGLLERLHWRLRLSDLLLARLGVELGASGSTVLDTHLSRSLTALRAQDLRLSGPLKPWLGVFGQAYVPVDGQLNAELPLLRLEHNWPRDASGKLQLQNLAWTLARDPVVLGSFQADLSREGEDVVALIHTLGGPLEVNGDARARGDYSYELHLQLKPKADAPPLVLSFLSSLGQPDNQGYYRINRSGRAPGAPPPPNAPLGAPPGPPP